MGNFAMTSKHEQAGAIAAALLPAERSMNQAAIDLLAVGTALFKARNSEVFHPLEGQRAIERFGSATTSLVDALGHVARAHDEVVRTAEKHQIMAFGQLCPLPDPGAPHGDLENVVDIAAAA
jgi:hypothetical protein